MKFNEFRNRHDSFSFRRELLLQTGKRSLVVSQIINPSYVGQSARYIGLRPPTAVATTTAYLYGIGLFVSRGVVPVLNITSAEMCVPPTLTEKGGLARDRERRRRRSAREATTGTTASLSSASNIRCTSRYQASGLLPATSVRASKERSCTHSFPLSTSETKGCVSDAFLSAVLSDVSQSLRFVSGSSHVLQAAQSEI